MSKSALWKVVVPELFGESTSGASMAYATKTLESGSAPMYESLFSIKDLAQFGSMGLGTTSRREYDRLRSQSPTSIRESLRLDAY
ncbi:8265_t:CDS:2 [Paraglomus occultum]|uniref:8265_t:CDS:1 n=1 Tax=Paraglomus occultum TaxID=144539 RepID=A0A9N9DGD6_9GLOM|nr:8265_t:CDS:2 [Paraglomus occultum]